MAAGNVDPAPAAAAAAGDERKTGLWLDCDVGHDDAFALMFALFDPEIEVLGVSSVHGNTTIDKTTTNTLKVLHACGKLDVPLYVGSRRPFLKDPKEAEEIHGHTGLDGFDFPPLPEAAKPAEGFAVDAIRDGLVAFHRRTGRKAVLVATGPLTNVALLLRQHPDVKASLERIVIMGGAIGLGNITPDAEFNIWVDPHAAQVVMNEAKPGPAGEAGVEVVMVPLEVTHTAQVTGAQMRRLAKLGTVAATPALDDGSDGWEVPACPEGSFRAMCTGLIAFFRSTYKQWFDFPFPVLHDACCIAYVLQPEKFKTKVLNVEVEVNSGLTVGRTSVDLYGARDFELGKQPRNVTVCLAMDVPWFFDRMMDALQAAAQQSPFPDPERLS